MLHDIYILCPLALLRVLECTLMPPNNVYRSSQSSDNRPVLLAKPPFHYSAESLLTRQYVNKAKNLHNWKTRYPFKSSHESCCCFLYAGFCVSFGGGLFCFPFIRTWELGLWERIFIPREYASESSIQIWVGNINSCCLLNSSMSQALSL